MLYFAYGSNMNVAQMKDRCPNAVLVGPGVLHNWKLVERLYADIEPHKGSRVYGVIWKLSKRCEASLDVYEGAHYNVYQKYLMPMRAKGNKIKALTYIMALNTASERDGLPFTIQYRDRCRAGALQHKIPVSKLYASV